MLVTVIQQIFCITLKQSAVKDETVLFVMKITRHLLISEVSRSEYNDLSPHYTPTSLCPNPNPCLGLIESCVLS